MRDHKVLGQAAATTSAVVMALLLGIFSVMPVEAAGLKPPPALTYTIAENTSLFVSNATMLAGQPSDASVQTTDLTEFPPNWGKITGSATGITYVPQVDYIGPDAFSYTVCEPPAGGEQACLTNFVYLTITSTASPSAQPSTVETPGPSVVTSPGSSPSGAVAGATSRPRATPPATADIAPSPPSDANLLLLVGLAIVLAGSLLLMPSGRRRPRQRR